MSPMTARKDTTAPVGEAPAAAAPDADQLNADQADTAPELPELTPEAIEYLRDLLGIERLEAEIAELRAKVFPAPVATSHDGEW